MSSSVPATLFLVLLVAVVSFQIALAAGAPWGSATMGGRYQGTLPRTIRVVVGVQAVVLVVLGVIVLTRAGLILPGWRAASRTGIWFVVGVSAVASILNLITPSSIERRIWAPVALGMFACALLVAFN